LTEDPGIQIETDLTLFLLYCARLSDKASLAQRLSSQHDVVVIDRLDLSLRARAKAAWSLPGSEVDNILSLATRPLRHLQIISVCLDANDSVRETRLASKAFRRRNLLSSAAQSDIRAALHAEARQRSTPIIDTSTRSPQEVVEEIELCVH
jgi:thymidylate kinase